MKVNNNLLPIIYVKKPVLEVKKRLLTIRKNKIPKPRNKEKVGTIIDIYI